MCVSVCVCVCVCLRKRAHCLNGGQKVIPQFLVAGVSLDE